MNLFLQVILRSIFSYIALLILVRISGKQQFGEMTFFDYIVGITIGSLSADLSIDINGDIIGIFIALIIWSTFPILFSYISLHNVWFRKVVVGEATIVIQNGYILEKNLKRLRITIEDLISLLRNQSIFHIDDVEYALIEPNGQLSVQKKSSKQNLTPSDMNINTEYDGLPTNLVLDGKLLKDALDSLNLSNAWLNYHLQKQNINSVNEISIAQLDTKGNLYIDLKGKDMTYVISTNK